MKLKGQMGEGDAPMFEVGATVTVIQAPDASIVGSTGTVQSAACGPYYGVEIDGTVHFLPDSSLGGERPAAPAPEAPTPMPEPTPAALAAAGGPSIAGQLEIATLAQLGRDVLRETGETSADRALLRVTAGMVAMTKIAKVEGDEKARAAAEDVRARRDRLAAAMVRGAVTRAQAFANPEEADVSKLTPRASWMRGTLADLDERLNDLGPGGTAPRAKIRAGGDDEAGLAERARRSGMTIEQRRAAEQNVDRGARPEGAI